MLGSILINKKQTVKNICQLFQIISSTIWYEISENNAFGNQLSEDGITKNKIISLIQHYVRKTKDTRVFAQKAINERSRGADLDIYVEVEPDSYLRFLLQAKILKRDGKYHDVARRNLKSGEFQWDLLEKYSKIAECKALYLFYNGLQNFTFNGSDCLGDYKAAALGCALTEINYVKNYCLKNKVSKVEFLSKAKPIGTPWRVLTCCQKLLHKISTENNCRFYSRKDIDLDPSFQKIFGLGDAPFIGDIELEETEVIYDELNELGWHPSVRIVISKTRFSTLENRYLQLA